MINLRKFSIYCALILCGLFSCIYVYDLSHRIPITKEQKPPFKIFQIGFHKCGTTTLAKFFSRNGIASIQNAHGDLALYIYNNYQNNQPLMLHPLRNYTAYFDMYYINSNPQIDVGMDFFKELDKQYPGSKFILNTRDKQAWLKSRSHIKVLGKHPYLEYSAMLNKITPEEMLAKWSQDWDNHHHAVLEYFKDRPDDLLVFNVETDPPEKLQEFFARYNLNLDPKFYIHENKTAWDKL
jgi:hypothetical protein